MYTKNMDQNTDQNMDQNTDRNMDQNADQNHNNGIVLKPVSSSRDDLDLDRNSELDYKAQSQEKTGFGDLNGSVKEVTADSEVEKIVPGSKEDPFRRFRWLKQICLVLVWICIVSRIFFICFFIHLHI